VNVIEEDEAVGVIVSGVALGDPTLGATMPPCEPSATVTVMLPLKTPLDNATVQLPEATDT
jgi:hypothetical protein